MAFKNCILFVRCMAFLLFFFFLGGCSSGSRDISTDYVYSSLARSKFLELDYPGVIVGIEKINWDEINRPDKTYFPHFEYINSYDKKISQSDYKEQAKLYKKVMKGQKGMVITHAYKFTDDNTKKTELFNSYKKADWEKLQYDFNDDTTLAVKAISDAVANDIAVNDYTHVFFLVMGWNNDQHESVYRFNKIIKEISVEYKAGEFKPYVVGVTWPSVWYSLENNDWARTAYHLGSYFNKAKDADEIAMTYGDLLLKRIILPAVEYKEGLSSGSKVNVVALGHSMGARIVTRSVYSKGKVRTGFGLKTSENREVDMVFALQPAFSVNRFIKNEGKEGAPYQHFNEISTQVVATSSLSDTANPIAWFLTRARHLGGEYGLSVAKSRSDFSCEIWSANDEPYEACSKASSKNSKLMVVDASSIVVGDPELGLTAHNDILDDDMAKLVVHYMDRYQGR